MAVCHYVLVVLLLRAPLSESISSLRPTRTLLTDRRKLIGAAAGALGVVLPVRAVTEELDLNLRPRNMMGYGANVLIPGDYFYIYNVVPPRKFSPSIAVKQPQWNAFGSCIENSCTYVPIAQRYTAYAKYGERLAYGLRAFQKLQSSVQRADWAAVATAVARETDSSSKPAPAVDALLKAGLLASQMLVSPNNLREKKEAALAIFYVNEVNYSLERLASAATEGDGDGAMRAWEFGRDSWNSYLAIVNRAIVPKVGEPFEEIV